MAVKSVKPRHERRRSSFRDGKLVHTLVWLVTCDAIGDGPATAITAPGVPGPGSYLLGVTPRAKLSGKECDPVQSSSNHFDVVCEFTQVDDPEPDPNPLHRAPEYSWEYTDATEPYFIDASTKGADGKGVPVVNSAGDAFEQFMERESGELVIKMTRNEATYDAAALDVYKHTVNKFPVTLDTTTYAVGTVKLSPITATKMWERMPDDTVVVYYKRSYVFKARHEGWHDHPLDVGFNELKKRRNQDDPITTVPIVDANGLPLAKPWPLDGKGNKQKNVTDKPAELDFQPYIEMDWTPLAFT